MPTVDEVLEVVNSDETVSNFRRSSFYRLLKTLRLKYVRRGGNSALLDPNDIVLWSRKYLRSVKKFRGEGKTIYYLDETWLNVGHIKACVWLNDTIKSSRQVFLSGLSPGLKNAPEKGKTPIITHIGNEWKWVRRRR
nr:unnamed protein product [Callosobruchus chinensis]